MRRTSKEGIRGGVRFVDHGQRMILLLGLVKGVPECKENLLINKPVWDQVYHDRILQVSHGLVWTPRVQLCPPLSILQHGEKERQVGCEG